MESIEALKAAWRDAEADVAAAEPGTTGWRHARVRADYAKTAYLTAVGDVFDVEGHSVAEDPAPSAEPGGERQRPPR
jgi:hypothetical protein